MSLSELVSKAYADSKSNRSLHEGGIGFMEGNPPVSEKIVTHKNFMEYPFNRWGFRNVEKLTRTTSIYRGNGGITPITYLAQDLASFHFPSSTGTSISLQEHLLATFTDGFIVFKDGKCLSETYADGYDDQDRHLMFSTTKSIVGLIAEDFVTRGVLDDSLLVGEYIPELTSTMFGDATVREVMDMLIGFDYVETYDDPLSNTAKFGYASGLWQAPKDSDFADNIYDYLKSQVKSGEHGLQFRYVTACTEAMVWVVERVSGISITRIVENIWAKLGCERDAYFVNDATGKVCSGGGFNATLRDMARFALMVSRKGYWNDEQILAPGTVDRIFKGGDPSKFALNEDFSFLLPGASYHSQWYVYEDESIMAAGIHGQIIYIHQPSDLVIVKQASHPEAGSILDIDTIALFKALAAHLS
jgi:CubicO group peptidase (beta-lactamase class C family)